MEERDYGPFPYSPMVRRPPLHWPGGERIALWIIPNIEFFSLREKVPAAAGGSGGPAPDVFAWSLRDYGNRVGVFRLMDVLDRHGLRGTVALNSDVCANHPEILAEGNARGWEWMGHNQSNTRRLNAIPPEDECGVIADTLATIERATGARPRGWLSSGLQETWATLGHLAAEGCDYVADWPNDDQPYLMEAGAGRTLVSVPYGGEINDKPAFENRNRTADEFRDMICRAFDVLWREGATSARVMAIALHPYIIGAAHRIGALEDALAYIDTHDGVWKTTGAEIARAYRAIVPQTS
jgi:allantoinase